MKSKKINAIDLRAAIWLAVMAVLCIIVMVRLFYMQYLQYDHYQSEVIDNIQQESVIPAKRGDIYDRNRNPLATNITTYRLFVSPVSIMEAGSGKKIATYLSEYLELDYEEVYKKTQRENMKDITIQRDVSEAQAENIRTFISENEYQTQIYLEATEKRYYPMGTLAASVIGAMGTDGGLFGLELEYDTYLTGTPGRYITTKDAQSGGMPSDFDTRIDPEDGLSAMTTIDVNIQNMLEGQLKSAYEYAQAAEKVTGIVMDPNTGAIYAMGTYPNFDLNNIYTLNDYYQQKYDAWSFDPSQHKEGTTEEAAKNEYFWQCVYAMWNNKAVSILYEPGSTMKMMTTAMALEERCVKFTDRFSCKGKLVVAGQEIHCHNTRGHNKSSGELRTFNKLLQLSCNPAIMQVAAKVGSTKFYSYFESFGYTSITGIDLPGEAAGLYVPLSKLNAVELACYSFGQTFKTTPLQQLTAVCAVANGGHLVTPHVVSSLIDQTGNAQVTFEPKIKRQVVSSDVCQSIMSVLQDGVYSGDGVKNAYVAGYRVAAKTGTSEKRDSKDKSARIGSCVAIAPADDPQVCVIIIVDEPQISNKYGSNVAAPYAGALMEQVLSYLGVERVYTPEEEARMSVTIEDYKGMALQTAIQKLGSTTLTYEVIGDGNTVTSQIPAAGEKLTSINGKIYLYTGGATATATVKMPDVVNKTVDAAIKQLQSAGLNVLLTGVTNYSKGGGATVILQSPPAGTELPYGSVVTLECRYLNETEGG